MREFVEEAFRLVGVTLKWEGAGANETGVDVATGIVRVRISPEFYRPIDIDYVLGSPAKAKAKLGWVPRTSFKELVKEMVEADVAIAKAHPNEPVKEA